MRLGGLPLHVGLGDPPKDAETATEIGLTGGLLALSYGWRG